MYTDTWGLTIYLSMLHVDFLSVSMYLLKGILSKQFAYTRMKGLLRVLARIFYFDFFAQMPHTFLFSKTTFANILPP